MELQFYNRSYQPLIDGYLLVESQLQFTRHAQECVQLASETRTPVLALVDRKLVTYFDLHRDKGVEPYSDNPNAILVRAFSTDVREQRKGYAKQALTLLPGFVKQHFPLIDEIVLAVNVGNEVAQALYQKVGFIDYGERRIGPKGELIIMSYLLNRGSINGCERNFTSVHKSNKYTPIGTSKNIIK